MAFVDYEIKYKQFTNKDKENRMKVSKSKVNRLLSMLEIDKVNRIIEIGCGDGTLLNELRDGITADEYFGVDISENGMSLIDNKHAFNLNQFDGENLTYPDKYFDLAVCFHVIEHVYTDIRKLLSEIGRVSKYQVFEIPIDFSFNLSSKYNQLMEIGHINIFTPELFKFLLKTEGYQILKEKYSLINFEEVWAKGNPEEIFKQTLLRIIPKLKQYKPNFYTVFTTL